HRHAHRARRGCGPHHRPGNGRGRLPAQTLQPARTGRAHQRGPSPPRRAAAARCAGHRAGGGRVRRHETRSGHAHAAQDRRDDLAHHRRIRPAQGAGDASAHAAVSRQADGTGAPARIRGIRSRHRHAGVPSAQADRARSVQSHLHPDRARFRLRLRARRPMMPRSLLWRAFLLIAVVIVLAIGAWVQIFRAYDVEPRTRQVAQRVVSVVNLTRTALVTAQPELRRELLVELVEREGIRIYPAEATDEIEELPHDRPQLQLLANEIRRDLGPQTRIARILNGERGFWVSFYIGEDEYWVMLPRERVERQLALQWVGWGALVLVLALIAAYFIVFRLREPVAALTRAARDIGHGRTPPPLDDEDGPEELRTVSRAFNQMSRNLAQLEEDRALILAGVSHDLRTPLARLRLGLEMSGVDEESLQAMSADIEEMDRII